MKDIKNRLIQVLMDNNVVDSTTVDVLEKEGLRGISINSMNFIKVVAAIEEEFQIEFDEYELNFELFNTMDELETMIAKKVEEQC